MTDLPDGYTFSAELSEMDRAAIHAWLSQEAYWSLGRTRQAQDTAMEASLNYGIFTRSGQQVAYARVLTDGATFGWLCDVFVDTAVRSLGIGKALVAAVCAELDVLEVPRTLLATSSAQDLYSRYGFATVEPAANWMIRIPLAD